MLGTAQLTRPYGIAGDSQIPGAKGTTHALLRTAQELGFRGVDTAPIYGEAEASIGMAGTSLPVFTKFDSALPELASIERSLQRLQRTSLEVVYFHEPMKPQDFVIRVPEVRQRVSPQTVPNLGVSVYEVEECLAALDCPAVTAIQFPFSVLDRRFSPAMFDDFIERGGKVFLRSIFLQGLLPTTADRVPSTLADLQPYLMSFWEICRRVEKSPIAAALWFAHESFPTASLIVGTRSVRELHEIASVANARADGMLVELIEGLAQPPWDMVDPRKW